MTNNTPYTLLITTYNRSESEECKPLSWTIDSILGQTYLPPVLIVDDGSNREMAERTRKKCSENNFEYFLLSKRVGCSGSRAEALKRIETPWHLILDDDSILIQQKTLERIKDVAQSARIKDTGAIIFSAYDRLPFPSSFIKQSDIGRIDTRNAKTYWNLNSFPIENLGLENTERMFEISTAGSYGVYNTSILKKLGGFKKGGLTDYAMESELAWRIKKSGGKLFYNPSIETSCMHLRYGIGSGNNPLEIIKGLKTHEREFIESAFSEKIEKIMERKIGNLSLLQMIYKADHPKNDTGCRCSEGEWIRDRVSNEFGQILAHYPSEDKISAVNEYIKRTLRQAKDFKLSRRTNSLAIPCNKEVSLSLAEEYLEVFRGLAIGIKNGIKWNITNN